MIQVYVKTDSQGRITAVNSSAFLTDIAGWTKIDEGDGDKYRHAQGNYLGRIYAEEGVFAYKLAGDKAVERTNAEILADIALIPPPRPTDGEVVNDLLALLMAQGVIVNV